MSNSNGFKKVWDELKGSGVERLIGPSLPPVAPSSMLSASTRLHLSYTLSEAINLNVMVSKWFERHPSVEEKEINALMRGCFIEMKKGPPFYTRVPFLTELWREANLVEWRDVVIRSRRSIVQNLKELNHMKKGLILAVETIKKQIHQVVKENSDVFEIKLWVAQMVFQREKLEDLLSLTLPKYYGIMEQNKEVVEKAWELVGHVSETPKPMLLESWRSWSERVESSGF